MKSHIRNKLFDLCIFAMFGGLMFASKIAMEVLPNIHLLAMFIVTLTVVYGVKALIPVYIFVVIEGVYAGFNMWWIPYLYIWTVLWALAMLLPKNMPKPVKAVVYPLLCAFHGIIYGTLYAPAYSVMFHLDFNGTVAWIVAGLPYDLIHCIGNLASGLLVLPLSELVKKLDGKYKR